MPACCGTGGNSGLVLACTASALPIRSWLLWLDAMEQADNDSAAQWVRIEREVLQLKADMPLQYVRREDYIRGQSVIESKLDSIASELKVTQIKIGGSPPCR